MERQTSTIQLCAVCCGPFQTPVFLSCTQRHVVCLSCARLKAKTAHAKSRVLDEAEAKRLIAKEEQEAAALERDATVDDEKNEDGAASHCDMFLCPSCGEAVRYNLAHDTLGLEVAREPLACVSSEEALCGAVLSAKKRQSSSLPQKKRTRQPVKWRLVNAKPTETSAEDVRTRLVTCEGQYSAVDGAHGAVAARLRELYSSWCSTKTSVNSYFDDVVRRVEAVRATKLKELEELWRREHALYESQIGVLGSARAVLKETLSTARSVLCGEDVKRAASIVSQLESQASISELSVAPSFVTSYDDSRIDPGAPTEVAMEMNITTASELYNNHSEIMTSIADGHGLSLDEPTTLNLGDDGHPHRPAAAAAAAAGVTANTAKVSGRGVESAHSTYALDSANITGGGNGSTVGEMNNDLYIHDSYI